MQLVEDIEECIANIKYYVLYAKQLIAMGHINSGLEKEID